MAADRRSVEDLLTDATRFLIPATGRPEPWSHGWSIEEYPRSNEAAIPGSQGSLALRKEGIALFERAVSQFLHEPEVKRRWDPDWTWGEIAQLVADASLSEGPASHIQRIIARMRGCGPALVVVLVANVSWNGEPIIMTDCAIGSLDSRFEVVVNRLAAARVNIGGSPTQAWISDARAAHNGPEPPVALAIWTYAQGRLAEYEVRQRAEDLFAVPLLLMEHLGEMDMWSLRGDANRPGIRGLTPDRAALGRTLRTGASRPLDLISRPLVLDDGGASLPVGSWYSSSPVPLRNLLREARDLPVERLLTSSDAIPSEFAWPHDGTRRAIGVSTPVTPHWLWVSPLTQWWALNPESLGRF